MFVVAMHTGLEGLYPGNSAAALGCFLFIFGFAAVNAARKSSKAKSRESDALKKIASMVNRSLEINVILAAALEEVMSLLGMDAGMFRMRATPEASPKTVYRGLSRETAAIFGARHQGRQ